MVFFEFFTRRAFYFFEVCVNAVERAPEDIYVDDADDSDVDDHYTESGAFVIEIGRASCRERV